jgi:hypothetical protein
VAIVYLWTHARLERVTLAPVTEARRRAVEVSIVITICSCFFFSHYYYLIALIIPFNVLLVIYLVEWRPAPLVLWGIAYFLVGAFVVPSGLLGRLFGVNMWEIYVWRNWFWFGEMLLVGLLMAEYVRFTRRIA